MFQAWLLQNLVDATNLLDTTPYLSHGRVNIQSAHISRPRSDPCLMHYVFGSRTCSVIRNFVGFSIKALVASQTQFSLHYSNRAFCISPWYSPCSGETRRLRNTKVCSLCDVPIVLYNKVVNGQGRQFVVINRYSREAFKKFPVCLVQQVPRFTWGCCSVYLPDNKRPVVAAMKVVTDFPCKFSRDAEICADTRVRSIADDDPVAEWK